MKILNFGSINIDKFFSLDHIVKEGETTDSSNYEEKIGGKGLNQSIALAKVTKTYHAGLINKEDSFIIDFLKESKVDTSYIKYSDKNTGFAFIQVDKNGENAIVISHGANFDISKDYIDEVLADFSKGDIILLQNEINNTSYIIDRAYEKGLRVILNPSPINEIIYSLDLNKVDTLLMNETEARAISKEDDLSMIKESLKDRYKSTNFLITLGSRGCLYLSNDKEIFQESFQVEVIDTTGAGDTFTGFFLGLINEGEDISKALELASKASALAVSRKGAASAIPSLEEVKEF